MIKYIVTDPCYILPSDIWTECCRKVGNQKEFNTVVTKALQEFTGYDKAKAVGTGCGDWSNCIEGSRIRKIITSDFTADSGMVCFCRCNDIVEKALKDNHIKEGCYAILELKGKITFTFVTSINDWTEFFVWDEEDDFRSLSSADLDGDWYRD